MTEKLFLVPPCPNCMRPPHKGQTCTEAALQSDYERQKPLPLCPTCNRNHKKNEPCSLRSREEEDLYRKRKW